MEDNHDPSKDAFILIYNPDGVVDRDIYLAAKGSRYRVTSCKIAVSKTPEGHTVEQIDLLRLGKMMRTQKLDFLLTINGAGLDNEGFLAYLCAYMEIPIAIWFVDEPFIIPEWGEKFFPQTTVAFTFDRFYQDRLRKWGIPWVYALPLGTNHTRMQPGNRSPKTVPSPGYPVSFVGALEYRKIQYLLENIGTLWKPAPPFLVDLLEQTIAQYRSTPRHGTEDVLAWCAKRSGVSFRFPNTIVKQMVLSFIDREASFRLRHETVQMLKPFDIAVFGDPFWKQAIGEPFYKGRIRYYSDDISRVYAASRINLNISKYQLKTTVNQRVFDCPMANGFLLTDYKEDLEEYFDIGKSVAVYSDPDDLKRQIAFYLSRPDQARRIVENGKTVIYEKHTYAHRLQSITRTVRDVKKNGGFKARAREVLGKIPPPKFSLYLKTLEEADHPLRPSSVPVCAGR